MPNEDTRPSLSSSRPEAAPPATAAVPIAELLRLAWRYEAAGQIDDAAQLVGYVLQAAPDQPEALHLSGIIAFRRGVPERSLALMERALACGLNRPLHFRNVCEVYRVLGRLDEALATGRQAVALTPADPGCLHNLALIHYHRLELDDALACAAQALAIDPTAAGAHFTRAEVMLLRGDLTAGWNEYEWRYRIPGAGALMPAVIALAGRPQWDGRARPSGKLLLIADQGFGDVIQFMRYIPWVLTRCPDIAIACSAETAPMLRRIAPNVPLFQDWRHCPDHVAYCPLSGLPRLAGTTLDNIPAGTPYLSADPKRAARWRERLAGLLPQTSSRRDALRVGLVWAGRPSHNNDRNRSMTLPDLAPLGALPGVTFVALQKGARSDQVGDWFGRAPLINIAAEILDFEDTMAVLEAIDVLVTIDSSVGHLAGAMRRPVCTMLPYAPDWRWLLDREDTPWYPEMRLFRQTTPRRWDDVVARVASHLRGLSADATSAGAARQ